MAEAAATSIAVQLQKGFQFPGARHIGLMLTVATFAAVLVAGYMWSQAPEYRILFPNVSDRDSGEIAAALETLNIPYKFGEHGTLMIPENQIFKARAQLAVKGLPKGASPGLDQGTERPPFGETESDMRSRHQRGLAVDLARSIETLAGVQTARVHLALTKPSPFMREQSKPTASVVLGLHPGRTLDATQVSAIVHMVSNAVPDLRAANVAVVDQAGNLLSTQQNGARGLDPTQLRFRQDMEQTFNARIEAILTPLTGANNVRAQVAADLDFSESEQAEEIYKPNGNTTEATIRSQQISEATNGGINNAGGVPGALSNQPPAPATAPITTPAAAPGATTPATAATNLRKDATTNFEVDKSIRHTRQELGRVKRLAVAVVVNHRKQEGKGGKVTYTPLKEEELAQFTNLVKEVVAYNKERGDTVSVINSAFSVPEKEKVAEVPLWRQPDYIDLAKMIGKNLLIAGVLLFIVLRVLRPALKSFSPPPPPPETPALTDETGADGEPTPQQQTDSYEQQVQQAKQLARSDPKATASMLKEWVSNG